MMKCLGLSPTGDVILVVDGPDSSYVPRSLNSVQLITQILTPTLSAQYSALSPDRSGAVFDGTVFTAKPAAPKVVGF